MPVKNILSAVFIIFFIFLSSGCSRREQPQPASADMKFDIDSSKISPAVVDSSSGLSFNPPLNWTAAGQAQLNDAASALNSMFKQEKKISVIPLYIFIDRGRHCLLNIARIDVRDTSGAPAIDEYKKMIFKGDENEDVKEGSYSKDGIKITQFLIRYKGNVNFRLLFFGGDNRLVQFDYIVPMQVYSDEVKAIESSIGSIKLIKNKPREAL